MKKIFLALGLLGFVFVFSPRIAAQTPSEVVVEEVLMEKQATDAALMETKKSEYVLPYPGILQNHPLYFLKDLRDKIIETLIVDPVRKSEFYLLQSDKWVNAAVFLREKGNSDLASKVLRDSTVKMTKAVELLASVKTGGREVPAGSVDRLEQAVQKHIEVLGELGIGENPLATETEKAAFLKNQEEMEKLR